MTLTVAKFGGSSMATGDSIRRVAAILEADPSRKVCVVSAPGRRPGCLKMTDLLRYGEVGTSYARAILLINELGLDARDMLPIDEKLSHLTKLEGETARMSFGEWLSAYLLSRITGRRFIDATEVFFFNGNQAQAHVWWQKDENVIIPGFYGRDTETESIKLFPRGGSDISASLIAATMGANLCENWTDVSGVYDKDPGRYYNAKRYNELSYNELHNLAVAGAQVIHHDAIAPLLRANIPLMVRNTFAPYEGGTLITQRSP